MGAELGWRDDVLGGGVRGFPGPEALVLGREEVLASKWDVTGRLTGAGDKPLLSV